MSLPDLLTQYANIIADEIINECVDDIDTTKFRMLRYHGHAVPDDIECSPHGILSVWWENLRPKNPSTPCPGYPVVTLNAKYVICFKPPTVTAKSITLYDSEWDATAARLAHIAECVSRRLMGLVCKQANQIDEDDDPEGHTFALIADKPVFLDAAPGGPQGGVAWVNWRIQTGINFIDDSPALLILARTADDTLTQGDDL